MIEEKVLVRRICAGKTELQAGLLGLNSKSLESGAVAAGPAFAWGAWGDGEECPELWLRWPLAVGLSDL